jgi:hypothetical protein
MNKEEAIQIIKQACAMVVANLETHQKIQEAIQVIEKEKK